MGSHKRRPRRPLGAARGTAEATVGSGVGVGRWGRSRGVAAGAAEPRGGSRPGEEQQPGGGAWGRHGLAGGLKPLPGSGRERAVGMDSSGAPVN